MSGLVIELTRSGLRPDVHTFEVIAGGKGIFPSAEAAESHAHRRRQLGFIRSGRSNQATSQNLSNFRPTAWNTPTGRNPNFWWNDSDAGFGRLTPATIVRTSSRSMAANSAV